MKDTIKLHEICGYLPYNLSIGYFFNGKHICNAPMVSSMIYNSYADEIPLSIVVSGDESFKPLLRPLSDLTKEIEHNGKRFVPIVKLLQEYCFDTNQMTEQEINEYAESMIEIDMSYMTAQMLMEWHFDIHGLINRNLALNLNDYEI